MRVVNGAVVLLCAVCFCASMAQPALAEDTASNKDAGVTSGTKSPPPKKIPFGLTEELLEPAREAARLAQQKRFDEAETKFKDLLTKVPNYEEGTCNLALIYDQTKRGKEALALLDTLVNKPAQTSRPYLLLSSLYTKDKQQDKALEVLNKATQHLSSDPEVWVRRAQFYSKTNVDKSEADYRKALELDPDNRTALNNLAVILMGQNRYAEALPLLKHYVKVIPKGASGRFNLASVHYSLGQVDEGMAIYIKLLEKRKGDPFATSQLALGHLFKGQPEEANKVLEPAKDSDSPHILYARGMTALFQGKAKDAEAPLKQAKDKAAGQTYIALAYAETLRQLGRLDEAADAVSKNADAQASSRSLVEAYLGLVRVSQGQRAEGRALIEKALSAQPSYRKPQNLTHLMRLPPSAVREVETILAEPAHEATPTAGGTSTSKRGCGCTSVQPRRPNPWQGLGLFLAVVVWGRMWRRTS